jgi:cytochrome c oxidase subunit III
MSSIKPAASQFNSVAQQHDAATLGMWVFIGTELMFFGPLFFGYLYGRSHFPDAFGAASRHTEVLLGTINTAVLLTSSMTMAIAVEAHKLGAQRLARVMLWATALLGVAFLLIKGSEYGHEWHAHLFPGAGLSFQGGQPGAARMFFILYFAMTALHAVHLAIGIALVAAFAIALQRHAELSANAERLELVGLYWHFVDTVWIFLYPLLYLIGRSN